MRSGRTRRYVATMALVKGGSSLPPGCSSRPLPRRFAQLVRDLTELLSPLVKSISHAREILGSGRPSPDCPTAEHIVLQAGIIGELSHGKGPVAEHALHKPND